MGLLLKKRGFQRLIPGGVGGVPGWRMLRSWALGPIFLLFFRLSFYFPNRYVLIGSPDPAFLPGTPLFP